MPRQPNVFRLASGSFPIRDNLRMSGFDQEGSPRGFATTHWSVILAAGHESSPGAEQALATLCETYWFPLYAYARRRGRNVNDAQDLTQEFFARLIEKEYVATADPDRGRFRAFLLTSFKHFLSKERDKARAQKLNLPRCLIRHLDQAQLALQAVALQKHIHRH